VYIYRITGFANAWLIGAGPATHLDGAQVDHLTGKSVPLVTAPAVHPQTLRCILHQSGLTESDMVAI
jgi:hypothetical protein